MFLRCINNYWEAFWLQASLKLEEVDLVAISLDWLTKAMFYFYKFFQYMELLMSWIETLVNNPNIFPPDDSMWEYTNLNCESIM